MENKYPERNFSMVEVAVGEPLGKGSGSISAEGFSETESNELAHKIGDQYLVDVAPNAPGCCIDGRKCVHTMAETATEPGPSSAGGPAVTAYAAAEMVGDYFGAQSTETSQGRMAEVADTLKAGGVVLGAHVSDGAVAAGFTKRTSDGTVVSATGCGASDEFKTIVSKPSDETDFVRDTTATLLGEDYDSEHAKYVDKATLLSRVDGYDSRKALNVIGEDDGENVEVLEGKHAEVLVVFNYVEGKTVDRDRLVAETGKQVFVVDMWYIDKLATALSQGRPDAVEMQGKLKHAMTAFQVSTYLTLCDGSHRPVVLKAQEQLAAVGTAS